MGRVKINKIILKERVEEEKLRECVRCINFPIKHNDKSSDIISKKEAVKNYLKIKPDTNGYRTITYTQKTGGLNIGRFSTSSGIALFPKEIKRYVSGEYYNDVDIVNCHPVIMKQLLEQNNIPVCSFLNDYINDRDKAIKTYGLKDKNSMYSIMNDKNCDTTNKHIKEFHSSIYNLYFKIASKTPIGKKLLKWCQQREGDNIEGRFIAYTLQDYERRIIDVCFNYCKMKKIRCDVSCYDGFMIDKKYDIDLEELSGVVFNEIKFRVSFTMKQMNTDWRPEIPDYDLYEEDQIQTPSKFMIDYVRSLDKDDEEAFMNYMNKFLCIFMNPLCIGFRTSEYDQYSLHSKSDMELALGDASIFTRWNSNAMRKVYKEQDFIVDELKVKEGVYNRFKRASMEESKTFEQDTKIIFKLIKIICNDDEKLYRWTIDYISYIIKYGKSNIALVFTGEMGVGKTTIANLISLLIGREYSYTVNNINTLLSETNGHLKDKVVVILEELSYNAGEFHKVHNIMKDKITNEYQNIRELYKNAYMSKDESNYIYISNFDYVIPITKDARRHVIYKVPNTKQGDQEFFSEFYDCLKKNIKALRYFFYHREPFNKDLRASRPKTDQERLLAERGVSITERFLKSYEYTNEKELNNLNKAEAYELFEEYCRYNKEKVIGPMYFKDEMIRCGYSLKEIRDKATRKRVNYFVLN